MQQLRSFLGLVNYYSKFVSNLATTLHPLNRLLKHDAQWRQTSECADAFKQVKEALVSSQVFAHYDPKLQIKMAADTSSYGIGAVVSHVYPDGSERQIAFTSRTLFKGERNYAQLEKEELLVYVVRHFHTYMEGVSHW